MQTVKTHKSRNCSLSKIYKEDSPQNTIQKTNILHSFNIKSDELMFFWIENVDQIKNQHLQEYFVTEKSYCPQLTNI